LSTLARNEASQVNAALDLLPVGVGVFDADLRLVHCNVRFAVLRGLPAELCHPGTPLAALIRHNAARGDYGAGDVEAQVAERIAAISRRLPRQVEQVIGDRRIEVGYAPTPDGGLLVHYADVTEARRLERALRENEERLSLASQAVAEGIYDWDIGQDNLSVSPRLMQIFGFTGEGLTSRDWYARVHAADMEGYRAALRDCFKARTPGVRCEYRILANDGTYKWVADHGLPVRGADGRAVRLPSPL